MSNTNTNTNKNLYSAKFVDKTRQRRKHSTYWNTAATITVSYCW